MNDNTVFQIQLFPDLLIFISKNTKFREYHSPAVSMWLFTNNCVREVEVIQNHSVILLYTSPRSAFTCEQEAMSTI